MKNRLLFGMVLLMLTVRLIAQGIVVNKTNRAKVGFSIGELKSISTYEYGIAKGIVVNKTDGTNIEIPVEDVNSISTYGYDISQYIGIASGHYYVDLGLPSGTMWAMFNIGASCPEDYGDYYAWGETTTKTEYSWATYKYGSSEKNVDKIGMDIAGTKYDVAHVKWGGGWRIPTQKQFQELIDNTTSTWITHNDVNGLKLVSKKNNSYIFLPAAGGMWDYLSNRSRYGYYWSSENHKYKDLSHYSYDLEIYSGGVDFEHCRYRYIGHSVRPVFKK